MAVANQDITLSKNTPVSILLGTSSSFKVQNINSVPIRYKVKDSTSDGGAISPNDTFHFNYDVDVWFISATIESCKIYVLRD